ncbi:MAG: ABC transporter ATP-binding protein [Lachnospiraceae bacterium]|nr:ABC transporter ATP-binding protein [Lachnospiraceae bacterium]
MKGIKKKPEYPIISNICYFYKMAYREFPKLVSCHFILVAGRILQPFLGILMPGIVLNMVTGGDLFRGLAVITLAGTGMLLCNALIRKITSKTYFIENVWRTILLSLAVLKETKCLYKYVEYGEQKDITKRAYQSMMGGDDAVSYRMLDYPRDLIVNIACFFLYSTVLGILEPWLVAFLILLSILNYGILQMKNRWQLALRKEFAQSDREIQYLNQTFEDKDMAKDARIFAMNDWLMAFRKKLFNRRTALEKKNNRRIIVTDCLQLFLNVLRNGLAYAYLIQACLQGEISVAGFLVYFGAITGFSEFVTGIVDTYSRLKLANEDASCLRMHMELPEISEEGRVPEQLYRRPAEIEFRDVSFSYGNQKIYDHFNLLIHPGEKVALLGINGAGKTTLVKLLCGLYEPDQGTILINGVDISTLPKHALYQLFSVVFQEAAVFPYPVGCNLSFQSLEETDEEKAWEALRRAGLEETFQEKGIGLDSFMTRLYFKDGVELSGGQTQRFLLARALYRDGSILILDEPTSALDPIAESEIYEEYVKFSSGRTSLFISHRLASTRFSDRILFLENGAIREEGTHEELMKAGGSYAHMFEVQSHYYREGEVEACGTI